MQTALWMGLTFERGLSGEVDWDTKHPVNEYLVSPGIPISQLLLQTDEHLRARRTRSDRTNVEKVLPEYGRIGFDLCIYGAKSIGDPFPDFIGRVLGPVFGS